MPPAKANKTSSESTPWDWATKTAAQDIGLPELQKVYRITGFHICKTQCRRNCKKNPKCLWGLGERKWLQGNEEASTSEEANDVLRNEGQIVGIQNLGATCYVNSLLQLWFHNPILRRAILEWKPSNEIIDPENYTPTCAIGHLQAMFARLKLSKQSCIDPSPFVSALELNAGEQQDAQEFSKLLMTLIDELLARYQHQSVRTVIKDSFTGECQYETECSVCKNAVIRPSVFNELELTVNKQLRDSIVQYLQEEILDGPNKYLCGNCNTHQPARRSIKLKKLPPVLNLQLMRFVYDIETQRKKKVTTIMRFPEELDMSEFVGDKFPTGQKLIYRLTAVLIHNGKSASSGHYVAHIKDLNTGAWYDCNDESVEKKAQPTRKSSALVLSDTNTNGSEHTNGASGSGGASGANKDQSQKVKFHSSPGAYMLVYTEKELHDSPPPDPEVHEYLMHLVQREDSVVEADLAKTKAEKESAEKNREEKLKEVEALYDWYKTQVSGDSENSQATEGANSESDNILEFFPASWLSNWLNDKQKENEEINTTSLVCQHGKLSPPLPNDTAVPYKILPTSFVDSLYTKYGGQNRLQGEQVFCLTCVQEQCSLLQKLAQLDEDHKRCTEIVKQLDKEVINADLTPAYLADKVWISKETLRSWKRAAKEEMQLSNIVVMENCDDEDKFIVNEDITCEHGELEPSENARKLVDITAWTIIEQYFTNAKCFPGSTGPCSQCNALKSTISQVASENKTVAQSQKQALSDLFFDRNRPDFNDCGSYYLVPTSFVEKWRRFIKNPASVTNIEHIMRLQNQELLCEHGGYQYPLNLICEVQNAQGRNESIVTLLKPREWEFIKSRFNIDEEIELRRAFIGQAPEYSPEICNECSVRWFNEAVNQTLYYTTGDVYIEKIDSDEKEPGGSPETSESQDSLIYTIPAKKEKKEYNNHLINGGSRRSTRTKHSINQKRYTVSSNLTLKELQLKLMNDYKAMMSDQHLTYEGREFTHADRNLTLGQLRIKPGSVLYLKVDESKTDDSIEMESPAQERGFTGTMLQGYGRDNNSQVPMEF